jgi:serine O-acetyltransferase
MNNFKRYQTLADKLASLQPQARVTVASRRHARRFIQATLGLMFPHLREDCDCSPAHMSVELCSLEALLYEILVPMKERLDKRPAEIIEAFMNGLPSLFESISADAEAIYQGDPAAVSVDEVIVSYPGFYATAVFRVAHELLRLEVPTMPRLLTELAHQSTGVDIHPGAKIGKSFCIDHATGIVIGETSDIGNNVKVYQGVTLGALSVDKGQASKKRHPTIEDNVVIYSNATILGGQTTIGHDSVIGGNVWLTSTVAPFSTVYHKSDIKVRSSENES